MQTVFFFVFISVCLCVGTQYLYVPVQKYSHHPKTCLLICLDRYECVGLFLYLAVQSGWRRRLAPELLSFDVDMTGHEGQIFATGFHWHSTSNL